MTIYECSTCEKFHDSTEPACPQVFALAATIEPESQDPSQPSWARRYFCPQCPRHRQPRDGFHVVDFQDHVHSHAIQYLGEAARDAYRMREALESIERLLNSEHVERWAPFAIRRDVMARVGQGLHHKDEAWDKAFEEKYYASFVGQGACSACGQAVPK